MIVLHAHDFYQGRQKQANDRCDCVSFKLTKTQELPTLITVSDDLGTTAPVALMSMDC